MPLTSKNATKAMVVADVKINNKALKTGIKKLETAKKSTTAVTVGKRSADSSPEGPPNQKRSVFGDLTNATKKNPLGVTTTKGDNCQDVKRITRSTRNIVGGNQNEKPESRKSKRLSDKKKNALKTVTIVEDTEESSSVSHNSSYETANDSSCSSLDVFLSTDVTPSSPITAKDVEDPDSTSLKKTSDNLFPVVPAEVHDFDKETALDPFSVALYAQDIFEHFKRREVKFLPMKYLKMQKDITRGMRSILVDWMAEVQESFELNHESLYLGVKLVDLYLSRQFISKNILQLLGSTAMLVAAKFDERSPPVVDDFLYICDDAYGRSELIRMEIRLLKTIDFDLGIPLSYTFLRRYARCSKQSMETLTLARYILELTLLEYDMMDIPDSLISAASLSLALQMKKMEPWSATLQHYSGYSLPELTDLIHRLNAMLATVGQRNLNTIPTKYSHEVFFEVAKITPLDVLST